MKPQMYIILLKCNCKFHVGNIIQIKICITPSPQIESKQMDRNKIIFVNKPLSVLCLRLVYIMKCHYMDSQ